MKKFTLFGILLSAAMLTACGAGGTANTVEESVGGTVSETAAITETYAKTKTTSESEETAAAVKAAEDFTDEELAEMYERAFDMVRGKEFLNDGNGSFYTEEGYGLDEYKEEFKKTFTDKYTDKYFMLEKGGIYFDGQDRRHLEIFTLSDENFVEDINIFGEYVGIWLGLGDRGSDISVMDNELEVTSRSSDKIVLTMTVWHTVPPDYEMKIGEDYVYRLENGNLVIAGKFGGCDDNEKYIIIEDELSGTVADVPVGKDKTEFYGTGHLNYLVKYDYNLVPDDGLWKFDNFEIWD